MINPGSYCVELISMYEVEKLENVWTTWVKRSRWEKVHKITRTEWANNP